VIEHAAVDQINETEPRDLINGHQFEMDPEVLEGNAYPEAERYEV